MSRKEIEEKFGEFIWLCLTMDRKDADKVAIAIAPEIERLLADERERLQNEIQAYQSDPRYDNRYLQGQDDMRKQLEPLLQAEREKVREMCANKAENTIYYREVDVLETDPNRLKKQIAVHIRQLDLTKDRGQSERQQVTRLDEGGEGKGNG